ncbi:MAG: ribosome recycling factor [Sphaerochaetaceae bacterium]|jgi:ribosome recycling factor
MADVLVNCEEKMKKSVESLKGDYDGLRTGRASASVLDKIKVDYYGVPTPINQVASVSVPEARSIVIQPWDKSVLPALERAIQTSDLGLPPNNDGKLIRLVFPPLTEERRKQLAKNARTMAENCRISVRNIRREGMDELKKLSKGGDISEDEQKDLENKLQKMTDSYILKIGEVADSKEKEIMEV